MVGGAGRVSSEPEQDPRDARGGVPSFDVSPYRRLTGRSVRFRRPAVPAIVLGSTQADGVVSSRTAQAHGVTVLRRRSGGGAVLIDSADPVWVDLWLPRDDPLFHQDVGRAAHWVGLAWVAALAQLGAGPLSVHEGRAVAGRWPQVCFAGRGPGEVTSRGRKVVGLAQWRGREGSLVHTATYRHWDAGALLGVLEMSDGDRAAAAEDLAARVLGLDDLIGRTPERHEVESALVENLPSGRPWAISSD
jgi:lipoate-protein ligase A